MTVLEPVATRPSAGRRWWLPLVPNLVWEMLLATALVVVVLTATVGTHHLFDYGLPWGLFATVGRRGGFAGVILAVGLVVALNKWMPFGDGSFAVHLGLYAVVILVGLQVSWGIGMIARAIDAQREVPPTVAARTVAARTDAGPTVAAPTVESSAGV